MDFLGCRKKVFAGPDVFCVLTGPHLQPSLLSEQLGRSTPEPLLRDKGWGEAELDREDADRQAGRGGALASRHSGRKSGG